MRRFFAAAVLLLACASVRTQARQADAPDWENPRVFAVGKEPPHATFVPYAEERAALRAGAPSPFVRTLDGAKSSRGGSAFARRRSKRAGYFLTASPS
ncbi:MAG: hypothetical protein JOZ02_21485 [Acidobacteria bacterium]|nr:hypothetical protein [Acidobacteriota bacterium]